MFSRQRIEVKSLIFQMGEVQMNQLCHSFLEMCQYE